MPIGQLGAIPQPLHPAFSRPFGQIGQPGRRDYNASPFVF